MGLGDLIDDADSTATSNQKPDDTENPSVSAAESGTEEVGKVSLTPPERADYDTERKGCPSCSVVGKKDSDYSFECVNEDCSTLNFQMGWKEFRSKSEFLGGVDMVSVKDNLEDIVDGIR